MSIPGSPGRGPSSSNCTGQPARPPSSGPWHGIRSASRMRATYGSPVARVRFEVEAEFLDLDLDVGEGVHSAPLRSAGLLRLEDGLAVEVGGARLDRAD